MVISRRFSTAFVLIGLASVPLTHSTYGATGTVSNRPNIVIILADDLGYGDVSCYGAARIQTPNVDRLAKEGLRFTDAHASSASCTPSRYALLTGEYPWRKKGTGVLPGDASLIIQPGRTTVPSLLQKAGYRTGVVGKWHLGLGDKGGPDWNGDIKPGPLEIGFDYGFIMPATGDRTPCVYVENHRIVGLDPTDPIKVSYGNPVGDDPTGKDHPELLKMHPSHGHDMTIVNGISRIGYMSGGKAARWVDEDMADVLTRKATGFIEQNKDRPFFLYFATHDIHVPRVPAPRFKGSSQAGVRGDVIQEFDWSVGQVMESLDRLKLADDTIVIVTSDNGGTLDSNGPDTVNGGTVETNNGHAYNGPLRAGKGSAYEGGTRVPLVARWPGKIRVGVSDELICHVDMLATVAALTGRSLADDGGPDSFNILPALLGEKRDKPCRDHLVEHGNTLAIRKGTWKLIPGRPAGENNKGKAKNKGPGPETQLYNLAEDIGETKNLAGEHPEVVKELSELLAQVREKGRSRP